jgi:hypothetical protein
MRVDHAKESGAEAILYRLMAVLAVPNSIHTDSGTRDGK